ncbi:DgyrCDS3381 [Dimorphilus gyrociliatus]|uniref:DgyrCDS3381 n=1 Tax=Dimorphilus gyrociliatus TaxID=2664684 RepID=A0A7I8VFQ7_9ANNE|nr:DgyrCDS3381 [Dimorphilus gyrociliatus]
MNMKLFICFLLITVSTCEKIAKKDLAMLRMGKRDAVSSFADESSSNFLPPLPRIGKYLEYLDRREEENSNNKRAAMLRMGKRETDFTDDDDEKNIMLRMGRGMSDLRMGKRSMLRMGKRDSPELEKRMMSMLRMGRNVPNKRFSSRDDSDNKRHMSMLRMGKRGAMSMLRMG